MLVAETEGVLVGYVTSDEFDPKKKSVVLETIYVHPDYRRIGIGQRLVSNYLRKWVDERGFSIHTFAISLDSFHFFSKIGFKFQYARMDFWT